MVESYRADIEERAVAKTPSADDEQGRLRFCEFCCFGFCICGLERNGRKSDRHRHGHRARHGLDHGEDGRCPMTRRNLELALLCIAAPFVIVLFAMLAMNEGQILGFKALEVPICLFIAFVIAHVATRFLAPGADPAILPITFALSGIGIAFVTRSGPRTWQKARSCGCSWAFSA